MATKPSLTDIVRDQLNQKGLSTLDQEKPINDLQTELLKIARTIAEEIKATTSDPEIELMPVDQILIRILAQIKMLHRNTILPALNHAMTEIINRRES